MVRRSNDFSLNNMVMDNEQTNRPNDRSYSPNKYGVHNTTTMIECSQKFNDDDKDVEDYEPYRDADSPHGTSFWGTVFHIVIICGGPGILTIPSLYVSGGYVAGCVVTFFLYLVYAYNVHSISWSQYQTSKLCRKPAAAFSYPAVVYEAFDKGPAWIRWLAVYIKSLSFACFIAVWFGNSCYNCVVMCKNFRAVYNNYYSTDVSFHTVLEIFFAPLLLLCWVPKLKWLVPVSMIGNICNWLSIVIVCYYVIVDTNEWRFCEAFTNLASIPLLMGSILFTLNGTGIMLSLKNEMKNPRKFDGYLGVVSVSFTPMAFEHVVFAAAVALKYGNDVNVTVIQNLPERDWLAQLAIAFSAVALLVQYPLSLHVPYYVIWRDIMGNGKESSLWGDYTVRTLLVLASFSVCYVMPNVYFFLSFSGSLGTSLDSLIIPAATNALVMWRISSNNAMPMTNLMKNGCIIALGLTLLVTGTMDCIGQITSYSQLA